MRTNAAGIALIKKFEGVRLKAYKCPAGVWTIGFGHTGPDVYAGLEINERVAEQLLIGDLLRFEHGVETLIGDAPTTPNQFSAMVSLAFNIGLGDPKKKNGFRGSSVLRNHNKGNKQVAAASFLLWSKAKGRILPGLTKRRMAERGLYLS